MKMDFTDVECIYCRRPDGHPCALKNGKDTTLVHLERKLLYVLRLENSWAQLLRHHEEGYLEETTRLRAKLIELQREDKPTVEQEVSFVDVIKAAPGGANAMRIASENCDLRELLDLANTIILNSQAKTVGFGPITKMDLVSWTGLVARFNDGYRNDMEKR